MLIEYSNLCLNNTNNNNDPRKNTGNWKNVEKIVQMEEKNK